MAKIILTGGGTAGHVTPHLSILPHLEKHELFYFGSTNGLERNIISKTNIPYYEIPCVKLNRKLDLKNLTIPFTLIKGICTAKHYLKEIKPSLIFSKGGYVALPTVIAGSTLNIPIISHESDLTVGLANKISQNYCEKILTSFEQTASEVKNGIYVGPPLREELFKISKKQALNYFKFSGKKPILLVLGGSQGSKSINDAVNSCYEVLLNEFDIIHICGKNNVKKGLNKNGYVQLEYLHQIEYAYSVASVCVSRAGSNTLFELLSLNIPTLLIPLPEGNSRGDQIQNAIYFYKKGMVNLLEQKNLTDNSFILSIYNTYYNKENLIKNISKNPIVSGSKKIADILNSYIT